ncbi:MAG: GNAT family N-acetyltransferase [Alphaproteobacteria bacterium]|jgi:GNAT superfamily N-acetyltransferase
MHIRDYQRSDAEAIVQLFYETIHTVNLGDYSPAQVDAWAPAVPDPETWHQRMISRRTLVGIRGGEVIGFADLEDDGHIDMFFCRHDTVRQGVGSRLYLAIEDAARGLGLGRLFVEASITARPFFERQGFHVVNHNAFEQNGVEITNFAMEKLLAEA